MGYIIAICKVTVIFGFFANLVYSRQEDAYLDMFIDPKTGLNYTMVVDEEGNEVKALMDDGTAEYHGDQDPNEKYVNFYLYTPLNNKTATELKTGCNFCIDMSNFNKSQPVKLISHGFTGHYEGRTITAIREAFFASNTNINLIAIDWKELAKAPNYVSAVKYTRYVGKLTADFIIWLVKEKYTTYANIHLIGFSLGGHVVGFTGQEVIRKTGNKLNRITGLDPANPLFHFNGKEGRLDKVDAEFVDVIHTSAGLWGVDSPIGHIDFYPNSGKAWQPGCGLDCIGQCSHFRAWHFFAESIFNEQGFPARKCPSWERFVGGKCNNRRIAHMGYHVSTEDFGTYYLHTNDKAPWGVRKRPPNPTNKARANSLLTGDKGYYDYDLEYMRQLYRSYHTH